MKVEAQHNNTLQKKSPKRVLLSRERVKPVVVEEKKEEVIPVVENEKAHIELGQKKNGTSRKQNIRTTKLSTKIEEMRKLYIGNCSISSPLRHSKTEVTLTSPKHLKMYLFFS